MDSKLEMPKWSDPQGTCGASLLQLPQLDPKMTARDIQGNRGETGHSWAERHRPASSSGIQVAVSQFCCTTPHLFHPADIHLKKSRAKEEATSERTTPSTYLAGLGSERFYHATS